MTSTPADISVALNGLSHIITPDLARDLSPELITMLTHSRAQIRKRALLALYKAMVKYPEVLRQGVAKLKDKLDDPDPGAFRIIFHTRNPLIILFFRCRRFNCQCSLRTGATQPRGLPDLGSSTVPPSYNLLKQLDAHQNRQIGE
jgi:hypothetical protein